MSVKHYWFGYLEAGEKSTPVLRDSRIDTGNPDTTYLFNLIRNEILEYRRDIIEPKLRELDAVENDVCSELQTKYEGKRKEFKPRGVSIAAIPQKGRSKPVAANDETEEPDEVETDYDDNVDLEWAEEEEA